MSIKGLKKTIAFLLVFLRLSRIDSCILTSLTVFLPIFYHTNSLRIGISEAIPILPIMMCGFVANDINDIEKDSVNHPNRPLPSKEVSVIVAVVLYFVLLSISLILIKTNIQGILIIHYIVFLIGIINYNYIVEYFPWIKNFYVATIGIAPILIAIESSGLSIVYYCLAISFALFILGREILMDVHDAEGDSDSLALRFGKQKSIRLAFVIQSIGLAILIPLCSNVQKACLLGILILVTIIFVKMWKEESYQHSIIMTMKLQMFLGLFFLT